METHNQFQDFAMPVHEVECIFHIGDGIKITVGQYKGQTGTVFLEETEGNLIIWTTISDEDVPVSFLDSDSRL